MFRTVSRRWTVTLFICFEQRSQVESDASAGSEAVTRFFVDCADADGTAA